MPNFGYHLARAEGGAVRAIFTALLPAILRRRLSNHTLLPFEVYSYSGSATLPEQVASIGSFLRHAGLPIRWIIVSDGTHSLQERALLESIHPCVSISSPNECTVEASEEFRAYLRDHPTGKQLALIMSLPRDKPALYVDSDVLFFPAARELRSLSGAALYLADCQFSGDERLLRDPAEKERPVNTGVLFLSKPLDWSAGIERFREVGGAPRFFTNQTITHLVLHANGAAPFDPRRFILQLDDQFIYPDKYAGADIVLRHYVQPVRHKFWTSFWRR